MATTKRGTRPMTMNEQGSAAFSAGVQRGTGGAAARREQQTETLKHQRDQATAEAANRRNENKRLAVGAAVLRAVVGVDGLTPIDARKIENEAVNEYDRCTKAGEEFYLAFTVTKLLHDMKTKKGEPSLPPADPRGTPVTPAVGRAGPTTWQQMQEERARYKARLRELGLTDPAFGSTPAGGGLLGSR